MGNLCPYTHNWKVWNSNLYHETLIFYQRENGAKFWFLIFEVRFDQKIYVNK